MREIKFRNCSHKDKKCYEPFTIKEMFEQAKNGAKIAEDKELCQFTGLLDKFGNEIFEGDIIQGEERQPNIVFWFTEKGMWGLDQKDVPSDSLGEFNENMKVIGNIYESPQQRI